MPSKPKIPKELMLDTALVLLRSQGYGAINIKMLAKALGCSTQPISWQFGGMDGFRLALTDAAMEYTRQKMTFEADNPVEAFVKHGESYVDLAMEEPNLFRFVFMGENGCSLEGGFTAFLNYERNVYMKDGMMELLHITSEQAVSFMDTMVLYTHGMASLIVAGIVKENKETAHRMLRETGITFLRAFGVDKEQAEAFFYS